MTKRATPGRFVAIVGPSGVGKDSLMQALAASNRRITLARRVITRPTGAGGEDFESVTIERFMEWQAAGHFALCWQAHGLRYGIPAAVEADLAAGKDVFANLSRAVLRQARARFVDCRVILLGTSPGALAARLKARGREDADDIAQRLARAGFAVPEGIQADVFDNSGALEDTVKAVLALLYPASADRLI